MVTLAQLYTRKAVTADVRFARKPSTTFLVLFCLLGVIVFWEILIPPDVIVFLTVPLELKEKQLYNLPQLEMPTILPRLPDRHAGICPDSVVMQPCFLILSLSLSLFFYSWISLKTLN